MVSGGTKRNSGFLSTNFLINQGHAIRSTFAFSRVTHFICSAYSDCLCKPLPCGAHSPVARWKGIDWIASLPGPINLFMANVKPPKSPLFRPILFVAIWTEAYL